MGPTYDKDEAQQDLKRRVNVPVVGGIYRHYKGGFYVVEAVSLMEETGQVLVTYRSNARGDCWTRDLHNFQESVRVQTDRMIPDSFQDVPRFRREGF